MAERDMPITVAPELVAEIVASYVAHHSVAVGDLGELITSVHHALDEVGNPEPGEEPRAPAVPVRRSVQHEYVVCLECGHRARVLRRHLGVNHGLTPAEYRARWNLPRDHPIVAPAYAEQRSAMAKGAGLGQRRGNR